MSSSGQVREAQWRPFCKAGMQITDSEQQVAQCFYRVRGPVL